jgi:protein phosphatase
MDRHLTYIENRLAVGIKMANQRIFEAAARDINFKGMGTTIVSGQIVGEKFYIAHVGDSRCYRIRGKAIQQMTRDHSLLEDYKDAKPNMSDEEQRKFPHKNVITRALGMRDTVQVDVLAQEIHDQDIFLLCSDGLSGMIEDPKVLEIVDGASTLELAVAGLIDAANQAGGTDNITVLALQCLSSAAA